MPTGYNAASGKTFSKTLHKWVNKQKTKGYDYEGVDHKSAGLMISFFRNYPDYFADIIRDKNAKYKLELPQRIIMRVLARYRNSYITGVRGLTKTYLILLEKMIEGVLYPGEKMLYMAPDQKQAAALATKAFHEIEASYPILAAMWQVRNDRQDMFYITTIYGSSFTMYSTRGDNTSQVIGEECGQEKSEDGRTAPFPIEKFLSDIYPTTREDRMVNMKLDPYHINKKHSYIGNACSKQNKAYSKLRYECLKDMVKDEDEFEGFAIDMSWITALMGNIRDIQYFKDLKKQLSGDKWARECCALYGGTEDNPLVTDDVLARCRKIMSMETKHCGKDDCIYIVAHDVARVDNRHNAKCADTVWKLTRYSAEQRRDKYRKQLIYAESYAPQATAYAQARKLRELWERYVLPEGGESYIVCDANGNGLDIVEELMKPTLDGRKPLCCYRHCMLQEIEQPGALPVIYPVKAGTAGTKDPDGAMIEYAQNEFEKGYVELLTAQSLDGLEQYKLRHNIKDDLYDARILAPYKAVEELCTQMKNIRTKLSGMTYKEERKSKAIQRDMWSSAKYGLWFSSILEGELMKEKYKAKSSWADKIESFKNGSIGNANRGDNNANSAISMREKAISFRKIKK